MGGNASLNFSAKLAGKFLRMGHANKAFVLVAANADIPRQIRIHPRHGAMQQLAENIDTGGGRQRFECGNQGVAPALGGGLCKAAAGGHLGVRHAQHFALNILALLGIAQHGEQSFRSAQVGKGFVGPGPQLLHRRHGGGRLVGLQGDQGGVLGLQVFLNDFARALELLQHLQNGIAPGLKFAHQPCPNRLALAIDPAALAQPVRQGRHQGQRFFRRFGAQVKLQAVGNFHAQLVHDQPGLFLATAEKAALGLLQVFQQALHFAAAHGIPNFLVTLTV